MCIRVYGMASGLVSGLCRNHSHRDPWRHPSTTNDAYTFDPQKTTPHPPLAPFSLNNMDIFKAQLQPFIFLFSDVSVLALDDGAPIRLLTLSARNY